MIFYSVILFIIGAIIGSFLNVVILRTKNGGSIVFGRSICPGCKKNLNCFELVPILSFILLGGKCSGCHTKISWQYVLVEFFTAVLYLAVGIFWFIGGMGILSLVANLIFVSFLVIIFVYDMRWQIIPDRFSIPAIVVIFILNLFLGLSVWSMIIGAIIAGGFFLLQFIVSRGKWIGGGDVRLGVLMGVALGWEKTLVALLIGYVGGAVISLILMALRRKKFNSEIAFGTFLAVASIIALFWGDKIINWYLSLI